MNGFDDVEVFEGKSLSSLFQEIHENSVAKKNQIKGLIEQLYPLIEGIGDATLLVPLIKEYLEIGVKNDEQLIKLAQIVQRLGSGKTQNASADDLWASLAASIQEDGKEIDAQIDETTQAVRETVAS